MKCCESTSARRFRWRQLAAMLAVVLAPIALIAGSAKQPDLEAVATFGAIGIGEGDVSSALAGIEVRFPDNWNRIRPWLGTGAANDGTWFVGAGLVYDFHPSSDWVISIGSGPTYYDSNDRNLGLDLEFYSFIEGTRRFGNGMRVGARVGHLSNAGFGDRNPGTEVMTLVFVVPITSERKEAERAHKLAFSRL